jgi:CO/xanthine dehydrogenase FAD-binding subunit
MIQMNEYVAPETVEEVTAILAEKGDAACILAGGTDVMVRMKRGTLPAGLSTLVSLHRVSGMRGVRVEGSELVIGAATTATDLINDPMVAENAPILARVADRMASAQVRNSATIGGNLANASPAGDLISPLLLLDARLQIASSTGTRELPVEELFTAPGETVLESGEIIVEIRTGLPPAGRRFLFEKAGTRPAMECSLVTVGLACTREEGRLQQVRVAYGSVASKPLRGKKTEAVLEGAILDEALIDRAVEAADGEIDPISDVRGSCDYRRAIVAAFLRRLLREAAS